MDIPSAGHLIAAAATSIIALVVWPLARRRRRRTGEPSTTKPNPRPAELIAIMTTGITLGLWVLYLILTISPSVADGFFGTISTGILVIAVVINLVFSYRKPDNGPFNPWAAAVGGFLLSAPLAGLAY